METKTPLSPGKIAITMAGLMLGLLMSALDTTIVGTAMPGIVRDLAGLNLYSWPFTAYLICSTVATLIFGKLSDSWGRRTMFLAGLASFIAASALCGAARSMAAFIAFRGLQGVGGGVIVSTAFALVGEAFPPRERGKYMGLLGGMYGLASVIGPTLGGLITDSFGWRWVFYVNLPLGLAALMILAFGLAGHAESRFKAKLDWAGIVLFILAIVPLLLALSLGGKSYGWASLPILGLFVLAILAGLALFLVERGLYSRQGSNTRQFPAQDESNTPIPALPEPFLPLASFKDREFAASAIGSFFSNAVFFAGILLIPLFLQRVLRSSATGSGLATTPLVLTYTLASVAAGQLISRRGSYRGPAIASAAMAFAATLPLCFLRPEWGKAPLIAAMILLGAGLGATTPIFQVAAQNRALPRNIGIVTSSIMFFRNLGMTIGSAVYGTVMSGSLAAMLVRFDWGQSPEIVKKSLGDPQTLMNSTAVDQIVAHVPAQYGKFMSDLLGRLDQGLASGLSSAFWAALAFAAAAFIACLSFEGGVRIRHSGRR